MTRNEEKTGDLSAEICSFFGPRIQEHGLTYQSVWGDVADWKATERFRIIEASDLDPGSSLVDLGCGTGLLKPYLDSLDRSVNYSGIDVVPKFIEHVRTQHNVPALSIDFFNSLQSVPVADWYALFGSMNKRWIVGLQPEESLDRVYDWISRAFDQARVGLYFNCFTARADRPKPENIHLDPIRILDVLGGRVKSYRIRHDLPFFEFTLMVRKDR